MSIIDRIVSKLTPVQVPFDCRHKRCPKCDRKWNRRDSNTLDCKSCSIRYNHIFDCLAMLGFGNVGRNKSLIWWYKRNCCEWSTKEEHCLGKQIMLPWLPLNITKQELDKYLVLV